jgi:hypothetical protein
LLLLLLLLLKEECGRLSLQMYKYFPSQKFWHQFMETPNGIAVWWYSTRWVWT